MASLQQVSDGRMFFGIGTGDSATSNLGRRPSTVAHFEAYCRAVQGLGDGEEVEWDGRPIRMSWPADSAPLWMAAEGPRTLHLAGQIADGVIIGCGLTDDVVRDCQARIRAGAESVGRNYDDIELWWYAKPYLAATEEEGWAALRWTVAGSAMHTFRYSADQKFVPPELLGPIEQLHREFAHHTHGKVSKGEFNSALIERLGLTEFLGKRFTLAGPPDRIADAHRTPDVTGRHEPDRRAARTRPRRLSARVRSVGHPRVALTFRRVPRRSPAVVSASIEGDLPGAELADL